MRGQLSVLRRTVLIAGVTAIVFGSAAGSVAAQIEPDARRSQQTGDPDLPDAARRAAAGATGSAERIGAEPRFGAMDDAPSGFTRHLVRTVDEVSLANAVAQLTANGSTPVDVWDDALFGLVVDLDADGAAFAISLPGVVGFEVDSSISLEEFGLGESASASVPDQLGATQTNPPWGLDRIDQRSLPLDSSYTAVGTGSGVTAYVLDSGLWFSHSEFTGRTGPGAYQDFGDGTGAWDCNGHGTHVAGTIGGSNYGVAKAVTISTVKVLDCDGTTSAAILVAGINWVVSNHLPGAPAVANMSVGGAASATIDAAVQGLIADGVTVVAAAGNEEAPTCGVSPAAFLP